MWRLWGAVAWGQCHLGPIRTLSRLLRCRKYFFLPLILKAMLHPRPLSFLFQTYAAPSSTLFPTESSQDLCYYVNLVARKCRFFFPSRWDGTAGSCLTSLFLSFSVMEGLEICLRRDRLWRVTVTSAPVNKCFQMQRILF